MLMDLDRFKEVNDTLGHHNGDCCCARSAQRLRGTLARRRLVARLGGDEFAVLLPDASTRDEAARRGARAHRPRARPAVPPRGAVARRRAPASASRCSPTTATTRRPLLQRADVAMYAAKESQRRRRASTTPSTTTTARAGSALVGELRRAIEQRRARPALPAQGRPRRPASSTGVEALVRWNHPEHGFAAARRVHPARRAHRPDPAAHRATCSTTALAQCRAWRRSGLDADRRRQPVGPQPARPRASPTSRGGCSPSAGVPPARARRWRSPRAASWPTPAARIAVLDAARSAMGVRLVRRRLRHRLLVARLPQAPAGQRGEDRQVVRADDGRRRRATRPIVRSIVDLGRNLGLHVVAEGVEDQETWDRLKAMGCHGAQGFHLGRPQPALDLTRWLGQHATIAVVV